MSSARVDGTPAEVSTEDRLPGSVAGDFTELGGQRTGAHDRTNPGQNHCDGCQHLAAQLTEHRSGPRVLEIDARRGVQRTCQLPFFLVAASDHRNVFSAYAGEVQRTSCRGSCTGTREQGEDDGVGHDVNLNLLSPRLP